MMVNGENAGWWFQTCFIFHHIWDVILPIDELHHFSRWLLHHQPAGMGQNTVPSGNLAWLLKMAIYSEFSH